MEELLVSQRHGNEHLRPQSAKAKAIPQSVKAVSRVKAYSDRSGQLATHRRRSCLDDADSVLALEIEYSRTRRTITRWCSFAYCRYMLLESSTPAAQTMTVDS